MPVRNEAVPLFGVPVFLIVSWDAYKLVQAWRAAGHSDEKPALSLSYQDKKPVISLIHSVSLELLQAYLPLGCTPHLSRRWKDPVKQNGGVKLLALIIPAVEMPEINFPGNIPKKTHFIKGDLVSRFSPLEAVPWAFIWQHTSTSLTLVMLINSLEIENKNNIQPHRIVIRKINISVSGR